MPADKDGIMRTGKLSEAGLKRAVLGPLGVDLSAGGGDYGADCAFFEAADGSVTAYTVVCTVPGFEEMPDALVTAAANNLAAAGALPEALLLHTMLPNGYEETRLREDMRRISERAHTCDMRVLGGHTEVSGTVSRPLYSVTGIGRPGQRDCRMQEQLRPGQELVLTKWIALAGTAAIARAHGEELLKRYPAAIVNRAKNFGALMSVLKEARIATNLGGCAMHDLSQGGVFGALWEMAERAGTGLEIDLRRIPIRQETVELCEYFDINPYGLYSAGSLLIGTDQGETLAEKLSEAGIDAAVIGCVTSGRERRIHNGEDVRYLDRPQQDEWYRRFGG